VDRSHLVSFLSDPEQKTGQERRDQIAAAGEHLQKSCRGEKAHNVWDEQWEEGVKKFIKAYDDVDRMIDELEKYYLRAQQVSQNKNEF